MQWIFPNENKILRFITENSRKRIAYQDGWRTRFKENIKGDSIKFMFMTKSMNSTAEELIQKEAVNKWE